MSRLLACIALVFAFASVGGPALGYAQGTVATVELLENELCTVVEETTKAVALKPCGKKRHGKMILCQLQWQLPASEICCELPAATRTFGPPAREAVPVGRGGERQFRPPRA